MRRRRAQRSALAAQVLIADTPCAFTPRMAVSGVCLSVHVDDLHGNLTLTRMAQGKNTPALTVPVPERCWRTPHYL